MEVFKIDITSWTASFRYPNLISGMQPTLEVPPLSTVLGLLNAAAGSYLNHKDLKLGYYFQYEMEGEDLETIYQISSKDGRPTNYAKSNVITRKFLYNNFFRIYTDNEQVVKYLSQPYYPILMGRMNDLATIECISKKEELIPNQISEKISGQIIPFKYRLPGQLQALPQYFTNEFPRKNLGTLPFTILSHKSKITSNELLTFRDLLPNGKEVDIYFNNLNFDI
ncbi:MAG: type I-B CRISPR-associated protein Cas5 [Saprospiraceae bacterium]|nr:type I-B CRISPR-associated protein Cas5 [Saprospiraceae bacterium]